MNEKTYGYVRVSTREQNLERQLVAMREFGVAENNIYRDMISGKDFVRPAWRSLLRKLGPGDVLVVKSIDRLGRNYEDILTQWRLITKEKGADVIVLDMPLLDTRQGKDLAGTLIADIVLQLLSYVAQTERDFIRQRQREGIAVAQAKGVRFGRPPLEKPDGFESVSRRWYSGELSGREAARTLGISPRTFKKWATEDL